MMTSTSERVARDRRHRAWPSLFFAAALFAAAGCGFLRTPDTTPTTFYVLSSVPAAGDAASGRALVLGLGPVTWPPYLDRPQMVSRTSANELTFNEFNRWSEPLKQNFERVLATDLDKLIDIDRVVMFPWYSTTKLDYVVTLTVLRFEPQPEGDVALDSRWSIRDAQGNSLINRESRLTQPGGSPAEVAGAMSIITGELARAIADALHTIDASHGR